MNFAYLRYVSEQNGATSHLYRPAIPVDLAGPHGEVDFYGLVDTGSDDTLIPRFLVRELGVTIDDSNRTKVRGIADEIVSIATAEMELRISDGFEFVSWQTKVGVIGEDDDESDFVILGHAGCLEFFTATFDGDRRALELFPNAQFPGITGSSDNGSHG